MPSKDRLLQMNKAFLQWGIILYRGKNIIMAIDMKTSSLWSMRKYTGPCHGTNELTRKPCLQKHPSCIGNNFLFLPGIPLGHFTCKMAMILCWLDPRKSNWPITAPLLGPAGLGRWQPRTTVMWPLFLRRQAQFLPCAFPS